MCAMVLSTTYRISFRDLLACFWALVSSLLGGFLWGGENPGSDVAFIGDAAGGVDLLQEAGGGDGLGVVGGPR